MVGTAPVRSGEVISSPGEEPKLPNDGLKDEKHSIHVDEEDSHIHKMLVLISAPLVQKKVILGKEEKCSVQPLKVWEEIEAIVDACNNQNIDTPIKIELKFATSREISRLDNYGSPLIVHFIGHGEEKDQTTCLLLEDENGLAQYMSVDELKEKIKPGSHPCKLAFLNSCYSKKLAEVFANHAGVSHVLAIQEGKKIIDLAARIFSEDFYPSILKGKTVVDSFIDGYKAVRSDTRLSETLDPITSLPSNYEESKKFVLLPNYSGIHNERLALHRSKSSVGATRKSWLAIAHANFKLR